MEKEKDRERGGGSRPRTGGLNECVKVVVRCRPLSDKETKDGHQAIVTVYNDRGAVQVASPKGQDKLFTYDASYDAAATQESLYDEMVRPLVNSVLDGFNGCVFAYGQTGTGKTHTMEGTQTQEGIIPRTFSHIWHHIQSEASEDVTYLVSCSYIELYMEDIRDLLKRHENKKGLTLRGQEYTGFYIPDMTSVVCRSANDMTKVMRTGNKHRTTGRTDMNEHSSRSHAIFLITVEMAHRGTDTIRVGKLNLVDLAGSERQGKTNASADRLKEASKINQALSSLGNVISALAENSPHVPYRDSKLTRILQDSLGGNSKTIMIANIGPASYNYDETITTLRYAHRAKAIKNKPVRNIDPKDAKLNEYKEEIARLRQLLVERKMGISEKKKEKPKKPLKARPASPEQENNNQTEVLTVELEEQNLETESHLEAERFKSEELESKIKQLEDRMVKGGVNSDKDLINNLNESQIILEQRSVEISDRKKREVEMQQKIDLEEESTAIVHNTFATLQQEVDHKTSRLKKCMAKYAAIRDEMVETREAHDQERREREAQQEELITELKKKLLLADNFVPEAGRALVYRVRYNEDTDEWEVPHDYRRDDDAQIMRPMAFSNRRRPISESVRTKPEMRYRCENLIDLKMEVLGSTTKQYMKPAVPAALREVLNSALARETDIEIKKPMTAARRRPTTAHHKTQGVR